MRFANLRLKGLSLRAYLGLGKWTHIGRVTSPQYHALYLGPLTFVMEG